MRQSHDAYPSRLKESEDRIAPFIRTDPVIHSGNEYRWHGPLDEIALSQYERDGFLWFKGFFNQERMAPFFDELREMAQDKEMLASGQVIQDPNTGDIRSVFAMHDDFPELA
ncbi:phytanoyl-CoA dioxygenase family protein [Aidingimonas lacisalsi]|uniref:hypothetical protein n=1 Tax=Aidingimonas lacisalsi TaxID=2604086 RepID=UPI0011D1C143|nr:hypothetical protein [Aidingimonas lacisalsi]